jgi:hypothetical protein
LVEVRVFGGLSDHDTLSLRYHNPKLQQQGEGGAGAKGSELRAIRMVLSENFIIGEIPTPGPANDTVYM